MEMIGWKDPLFWSAWWQSLFIFIYLFGILPLIHSWQSRERQEMRAQREGCYMQGSPSRELNCGRCGYVICILTVRPPRLLSSRVGLILKNTACMSLRYWNPNLPNNTFSSLSSQLFHDPDGFGFRKKARMYIHDLWNILDVLSILLFIIGLVFR